MTDQEIAFWKDVFLSSVSALHRKGRWDSTTIRSGGTTEPSAASREIAALDADYAIIWLRNIIKNDVNP